MLCKYLGELTSIVGTTVKDHCLRPSSPTHPPVHECVDALLTGWCAASINQHDYLLKGRPHVDDIEAAEPMPVGILDFQDVYADLAIEDVVFRKSDLGRLRFRLVLLTSITFQMSCCRDIIRRRARGAQYLAQHRCGIVSKLSMHAPYGRTCTHWDEEPQSSSFRFVFRRTGQRHGIEEVLLSIHCLPRLGVERYALIVIPFRVIDIRFLLAFFLHLGRKSNQCAMICGGIP